MSNIDNNLEYFSRENAAEAATLMRQAAQQAKVFEPSVTEINDGKREAWNRTVLKIKDIYSLDSSVLLPHKSMEAYSVSSGGYVSGPAFIGESRFEVGTRINALSDEEPGIDFGNDTIVPYLYKSGQYGASASQVYTAIAEALEQYASNGAVHKDSLGCPQMVPDSLAIGEFNNEDASAAKKWWQKLF